MEYYHLSRFEEKIREAFYCFQSVLIRVHPWLIYAWFRLGRGQLHQIFDMAIGIQIVDGVLIALYPVKFVFVEHHENLGFRINIGQQQQMIRILPVQQGVPRIAGAGQFEQMLKIRGATKHIRIPADKGKEHNVHGWSVRHGAVG